MDLDWRRLDLSVLFGNRRCTYRSSYRLDQSVLCIELGFVLYSDLILICIGNWKCNGTLESVKELVKILNEAGPIPANVEVVVGVPSIHIGLVLATIRDDIQVAAQNCGVNSKCGAYTGETCASQLVDMGVTWVRPSHQN